MMPEEAVTRFLRGAPPLRCPDDLLARLRATIDTEVELRHASRVEPEADRNDLKPGSQLWSHDAVDDA